VLITQRKEDIPETSFHIQTPVSLEPVTLPLQLIFGGKTSRCLPQHTGATAAARFHLTFSDNHWSSQRTMQEWITEVLMPHAEVCIQQHRLASNAAIVLVSDRLGASGNGAAWQ